ncbi:rhodanese-like domain-containing protein [Haloplanus sp. GCM10025708]|uniref:rhodanese-like domain-containing protein n=1 Tax=Haloferacaceae TaxID=1644056 RepID=UPI0036203DDA
MDRRTILRTAGGALLAGSAGCLGGSGGSDHAFSEYETVTVDGVDVPLAPMADVHRWYENRDLHLADARSRAAYERSHIEGAVWSPAPDGREGDDPASAWDPASLVVCYCGCPHHLSSMRAASLIDAGYERVAALDEGYWAWKDAGHPIAGSEASIEPPVRVVRGRTDPQFAGESAWARHDPSGQMEATAIADDGSYELHLRFAGVSDASPVRITTPTYEIERSLSALTTGVVDG